MKKRESCLIAIILMLFLSLIAGCDKKGGNETTQSQDMNKPTSETKAPEPNNTKDSSESSASLMDEYQPIDPTELSFELKGYYSRSFVGEDGIPKTVGGKVEQLICEGKTIELVSNEFDGEFLETKQYGKIKIQFSSSLTSSGFIVWLTPKQKEVILRTFKI